MKRMLLALALAGAFVVPASAQQIVTTQPSPRVTTQAAVAVATTNTFVQAMPANPARGSCTIQYQGTTIGYVFFGASPTVAAAFELTAGQSISCVSGGITLTDAVNVTGTAGDTFVVAYQ